MSLLTGLYASSDVDVGFQFCDGIVFFEILCVHFKAKVLGEQNTELNRADGSKACLVNVCVNAKARIADDFCQNSMDFFLRGRFGRDNLLKAANRFGQGFFIHL
ncbi:MAG: hypothetical protein EUB_03818 [Eubacterium sp.]